MKAPRYARPLTDAERGQLTKGLRSSAAFTLRRCQILLASARGETPRRIGAQVGCSDQAVRDTIRAFHDRGLAALARRSSRPATTRPAFDAGGAERLRERLHRSPREFGRDTGLWTLPLAAEVRCAEGLTAGPVSGETVRATLARLGVRWQRAKRWIARPDWVLGFGDATWWSRLASPARHAWAEAGRPLRLVERAVAADDPDPKALAADGLSLPATGETLLRFVDGRPVGALTTPFLAWCCERLARRGKTARLLTWDNAGWHSSKEVRAWVRAHNRAVKRQRRGVRLVVCQLPVKRPWRNPLEPKWGHAKRHAAEPARLLTACETAERACQALGCAHEEHLALPKQVA